MNCLSTNRYIMALPIPVVIINIILPDLHQLDTFEYVILSWWRMVVRLFKLHFNFWYWPGVVFTQHSLFVLSPLRLGMFSLSQGSCLRRFHSFLLTFCFDDVLAKLLIKCIFYSGGFVHCEVFHKLCWLNIDYWMAPLWNDIRLRVDSEDIEDAVCYLHTNKAAE